MSRKLASAAKEIPCALRKTRLKKNVAQVFWPTLKQVIFWTSGYGNCRAVETVENELHVFHRSHRAWKTRQTAPEFSTVPTASTAGYCSGKRRNHAFAK